MRWPHLEDGLQLDLLGLCVRVRDGLREHLPSRGMERGGGGMEQAAALPVLVEVMVVVMVVVVAVARASLRRIPHE